MSGLGDFLALARGKDLLIDANLVLLKIVGDVRPGWIGHRPRTSHFTANDYEILDRLLASFVAHFGSRLVVTPNVLTEVSNLLGDFKGRERPLVFDGFVATLSQIQERYVPSEEIGREPGIADFGLIDLGLFNLAKAGHLLVTADARLAARVQADGIQVLTLDMIRAIMS